MSPRDEIRAARKEARASAFAEIARWAQSQMTGCMKNAANTRSLAMPDWHMNRFTVYELVSNEALRRAYKAQGGTPNG